MPDWTPEEIASYRATLDLLCIAGSYAEVARADPDTFVLRAPAAEADLRDAERHLGVSLPQDLRQLYVQSDGLRVRHDWLIVSLAEMVSQNQQFRHEAGFRSRYMPFDHLLFFAAAPNGDLFGYGIHMDGSITEASIYGWNHESDARPWVAGGVRDLVARFASGMLLDASG